jgi:hypothetical protein
MMRGAAAGAEAEDEADAVAVAEGIAAFAEGFKLSQFNISKV